MALMTLALAAADHWTTYVCLRSSVPGFEVTEANPIADWLFDTIGLIPGIALDTVVTLVAVSALVMTRLVPRTIKTVFFAVVIAWTGYAVVNNLHAIHVMGLPLLGGA